MSKLENNSSQAPTPGEIGETEELKNNVIICPDCGSSIEILSITENKIEYRCLNEKKKHTEETKFTKTIEEYLEKIKENKDNIFDEIKDKCHIENHNLNNYVSYCLDCRCHLCVECLKTRKHINHRKSNMIEILPREDEIKLIKEVINDYKNEKKNLDNIIKQQTKEIKQSLEKQIAEEESYYNKKVKLSEEEKSQVLKIIENEYLSQLEEIKKEYDRKVKIRKDKYLEQKEKIINDFKLKNEKFLSEKKIIIKKLEDNYKVKIKNLESKIIENNENILELNEIIYNTYINYSNN